MYCFFLFFFIGKYVRLDIYTLVIKKFMYSPNPLRGYGERDRPLEFSSVFQQRFYLGLPLWGFTLTIRLLLLFTCFLIQLSASRERCTMCLFGILFINEFYSVFLVSFLMPSLGFPIRCHLINLLYFFLFWLFFIFFNKKPKSFVCFTN